MRKAQKQEILDFIESLHQAHEEIRGALKQQNTALAKNMLGECQEFAAALGETIEKMEGEGHVTVSFVEEYCETLFHVFEEITQQDMNENRVFKVLRRQLLKVENSVKNDIAVRKEIVFFPYKASMWDSLESIYLAAREDPDCDAYCVPIPYYDLNPDHSFGKMHDEGREYPEDIEIIDWREYKLEERKPDVVYIHNPYDNWNHVTSVHPRYYSSNLKKYTECLVYVPYYSTSGGMNEAQSLCPAYIYADYIVVQSPKFKGYFDKSISDKKFLPLGSPKFDRVIRKCQEPPQPPKKWQEKMAGKKVYFYNTSITGMLADTEGFLEKMKYVFSCFQGREDACLLWRPHPLLEATFDSMRPEYRPVYDTLKKVFTDYNLGIYDDTPDVTDSVALSDAYIGDAKSSVTSLFGVAGKPVFILNNKIHSKPGADSWREELNISFNMFDEESRCIVLQGNKLYVSKTERHDYKYFCDLSEYSCSGQYSFTYEIEGKKYVCPFNAQDILMVGEHGVEKKIKLAKTDAKTKLFGGVWNYKRYLILLPLNYPALVRYDTATGQIKYFTENIEIFCQEVDGVKVLGGSYLYEGVLFVASPTDNRIYKFYIETGGVQILELPVKDSRGYGGIAAYREDMWFLPYEGKCIVRWNLQTGKIREYAQFPEQFFCISPTDGQRNEELPFCTPIFYNGFMYLPPCRANMYLKLDIETGKFTQWQPSFEDGEEKISSIFYWEARDGENPYFKIYSYIKKKLYSINMETYDCEEIPVLLDKEEMRYHEPGFCKYSEQMKYICVENAFNSLGNFIDGKIAGGQFNKEEQLAAYREIASNCDGSCGEEIYKFIKAV